MFTVSIRNKGGDPSALQSFPTLAEAQSFAARERSRSAEEPDAKRCGWEWSISDDEGACWPTDPDGYTVVFSGDNWSFYRDSDEIPEGWTVWASSLTWEAAHDAIA